MSMKDFQILSKLGEGAFSIVYKAKRISDGMEYALKKVRMSGLSMKEKENALNEVRILASIRFVLFCHKNSHPNIVAYKETFIDETTSSLCIVMEFAEKGDLLGRIAGHITRKSLFPENEIWSMFIQVVGGLRALHERRILHRDIKCANIFLAKDGTVKIGDLNVSKVAKKGLLYTQTGTPYYASPEIWKDKPYDAKSDMWSLGCVIYEAVTLHPPFRAADMQGLYRKVIAGNYPEIPRGYSAELSQVIKSLLQLNPGNRPTCEQLMDMPIIQKKAKELNIELTMDKPMAESNILGTIFFPRHISALSSRLPKPNYAPCPQPQFQKYSAISNSLQNRSRSINGIRPNNASADMLEPVKEERRPSERQLKPKYMRVKHYGDKSEVLPEKERDSHSRRAQYRKPLASLENDAPRGGYEYSCNDPKLPAIRSKPPIPLMPVQPEYQINKRLQRIWK